MYRFATIQNVTDDKRRRQTTDNMPWHRLDYGRPKIKRVDLITVCYSHTHSDSVCYLLHVYMSIINWNVWPYRIQVYNHVKGVLKECVMGTWRPWTHHIVVSGIGRSIGNSTESELHALLTIERLSWADASCVDAGKILRQRARLTHERTIGRQERRLTGLSAVSEQNLIDHQASTFQYRWCWCCYCRWI